MKRPEEQLHRACLAYLRATLDYDAASGVFTWRAGQRRAGQRAGTLSKGYRQIQIKIDGKAVGLKEHRIAWLFVHGEWPAAQIDHIDGDRSNNRIANLRLATNSQNMANRKLNANSKSGVKGVCWHNGSKRWRARLQHNGTRIHLGDYKNKEAAEIAYEAAAKRHFGEYARLK